MDVYRQMHIPYTDENQLFPTLTPNTVYYSPGLCSPVYPADIGGFGIKKRPVFT